MYRVIIGLILLTIFGCQRKVESNDVYGQLSGNIFSMTTMGEEDTLTIEFKDSTFNIYQYIDGDLPWRIQSLDNIDFLVLNTMVLSIQQRDEHRFEGISIGQDDFEILFEKRNIEWNKELLEGTWIYQKHYILDYKNNEFTKPPVPPAPPGFSEDDFQYPPRYKINADSITVMSDYYVSTLKIDLDMANQFGTMKILSNSNEAKESWKIKELTDSILIIDRKIVEEDSNFKPFTKIIEDVKLIKERS